MAAHHVRYRYPDAPHCIICECPAVEGPDSLGANGVQYSFWCAFHTRYSVLRPCSGCGVMLDPSLLT